MKETEFFYEPCVDEAQTIRNMKRQLLFLSSIRPRCVCTACCMERIVYSCRWRMN